MVFLLATRLFAIVGHLDPTEKSFQIRWHFTIIVWPAENFAVSAYVSVRSLSRRLQIAVEQRLRAHSSIEHGSLALPVCWI